MKKILFSAMVVVMALCFAACGSSGGEEKNTGLYARFEDSEYTECPDWEGKTVGELIEEGYSYNGHSSGGKHCYIILSDDAYEYDVILEDSATDIVNNIKFEMHTDEVLQMLNDCIVEKSYYKYKSWGN